MRKSNPAGDDIALNLFDNCISGAGNGVDGDCPSEGCPNPYAEASQARITGRTPMPMDTGKVEPRVEFEPVAVSDEERRHQPEPINDIPHPETKPRVAEDQPGSGRLPKDQRVTETAPRLMKADALATYLAMSRSKVCRLTKKDLRFPKPIGIGGSKYWDRWSIDRYIDDLVASGLSDR